MMVFQLQLHYKNASEAGIAHGTSPINTEVLARAC
jgi:hypothetical protein